MLQLDLVGKVLELKVFHPREGGCSRVMTNL